MPPNAPEQPVRSPVAFAQCSLSSWTHESHAKITNSTPPVNGYALTYQVTYRLIAAVPPPQILCCALKERVDSCGSSRRLRRDFRSRVQCAADHDECDQTKRPNLARSPHFHSLPAHAAGHCEAYNKRRSSSARIRGPATLRPDRRVFWGWFHTSLELGSRGLHGEHLSTGAGCATAAING